MKRFFLCLPLWAALVATLSVPSCSGTGSSATPSPPNFIIIFTDDQGYHDLGCFGSETIKTPAIDKMASEGLMMTSFYAQPVCGPSRGALLTGRYPLRIGGGWRTNPEEITLAEILKKAGYTTGCIGKWDISQRRYQEGLVPNDQGFDYFFGTLGANDRGRIDLYRNRDLLFPTNDMASLTKMYSDDALRFINNNRDQPFFLYLAHTMPHVVIDASRGFKGRSEGELYGDVIEEIDWNTGRIFGLLDQLGLDEKTLVVFLSDNGPWSNREAVYRERHRGQKATGSAFPLRSAKGSPYEGGFRVPCVFWAPGMIAPGGVSRQMMASIDILPTFAKLAGVSLPGDRILDGRDQSELLLGKKATGARELFYYHIKGELQAVRKGNWKLLLPNPTMGYAYVKDPERTEPELYDLEKDVGEKHNRAKEFPEMVEQMLQLAREAPNRPEDTGP